jgi:hypothetical protein
MKNDDSFFGEEMPKKSNSSIITSKRIFNKVRKYEL